MRNNYPATPPTYDPNLTENAINTSYNGLNALPDGTIVVKSLYRVAGCTLNGPSALLKCPNSQNVPASNLISVNPKKMQIVDKITLPAFAGAGPAITRYRGVDYVYLLENISSAVRYSVKKGIFTLDTSWTMAWRRSPRKVAAFRIGDSGITTVWKKNQTTTEWATLIGRKEHRVWVGTEIPDTEIPGNNTTEVVVWRAGISVNLRTRRGGL